MTTLRSTWCTSSPKMTICITWSKLGGGRGCSIENPWHTYCPSAHSLTLLPPSSAPIHTQHASISIRFKWDWPILMTFLFMTPSTCSEFAYKDLPCWRSILAHLPLPKIWSLSTKMEKSKYGFMPISPASFRIERKSTSWVKNQQKNRCKLLQVKTRKQETIGSYMSNLTTPRTHTKTHTDTHSHLVRRKTFMLFQRSVSSRWWTTYWGSWSRISIKRLWGEIDCLANLSRIGCGVWIVGMRQPEIKTQGWMW